MEGCARSKERNVIAPGRNASDPESGISGGLEAYFKQLHEGKDSVAG